MSDRSRAGEEVWRRRLSALIEDNGGVSAVARLADLPVQTLRNHLGRTKKPPLDHLRRVAAACGVDFLWLADLSDAASSRLTVGEGLSSGGEAEAGARPSGFEETSDLVPYDGMRAGPSHGRSAVNSGRWTVTSRALELAGFLPGDVVEFEIGAKPRPGEVVVAQVYSQLKPTAETVLRLWHPPFLTVHTADPAVDKRPLEVDATGERVKIMGAFVSMTRLARR